MQKEALPAALEREGEPWRPHMLGDHSGFQAHPWHSRVFEYLRLRQCALRLGALTRCEWQSLQRLGPLKLCPLESQLPWGLSPGPLVRYVERHTAALGACAERRWQLVQVQQQQLRRPQQLPSPSKA